MAENNINKKEQKSLLYLIKRKFSACFLTYRKESEVRLLAKKLRQEYKNNKTIKYIDTCCRFYTRKCRQFDASMHHGYRKRRKNYSSLASRMTIEERRERNGDKNRREGYTSTGVKLATHEQFVAMHNEKVKHRKENPTARRAKAKIFISVCMGGQNKRY